MHLSVRIGAFVRMMRQRVYLPRRLVWVTKTSIVAPGLSRRSNARRRIVRPDVWAVLVTRPFGQPPPRQRARTLAPRGTPLTCRSVIRVCEPRNAPRRRMTALIRRGVVLVLPVLFGVFPTPTGPT